MNAFEKYGKLKVVGTQLCDCSGNPIQLKGPSTLGMVWYPEIINERAFENVHEWGANLIRLAMYTAEEDGYLTGGDREYTKDLIDKGVKYATGLGMYVIIDWHILSDGNPLDHKTEAIAFFEEMTAKYKGCDNIIYEICNEPNGEAATWEAVKEYAEAIVPVIRKNCPDSAILIGTPNWSQRVDQAADNPVKGENLMYSLHYYAASHKQPLRDKVIYALSKGLPIFFDEYSNCDASGNGIIDEEEAHEWARLADEKMISYAQWNLSYRDESSAMIKADCEKVCDWTDEEMTTTGLWMKARLSGKISYLK